MSFWEARQDPRDPKVLKYARRNRRNPTRAERVLWSKVRNRQTGYEFFTQAVLCHSRFIADLYCPQAKLVVELDGGYHDTPEQQAYDAWRTQEMEQMGYTVIRFRNEEVLKDPDEVVRRILHTIQAMPVEIVDVQGRPVEIVEFEASTQPARAPSHHRRVTKWWEWPWWPWRW